MIISVKSANLKELERIEKLCRWHRKFVWWPIKLKCSKGMEKIAWLTFVHRKAKLGLYCHHSHYHPRFDYRHCMADDAIMHALEHNNKIEFNSIEAREYYKKSKEICNNE